MRRANPVGSLVLLRSHPELFQLATIQFIAYVAHEVFNVWALYAIFRYAWNEGKIGLSLALVGVYGGRDDQRPTINDQRPTINDQRSTTNDQRPTACASTFLRAVDFSHGS